MPDHFLRHAVNIDAPPAKVRDALTTLQGLKGWMAADEVSGGGKVGAQWSLKYADGPDPKSTTMGISSKIGMDCTVPIGQQWNPNEFVRSTVTDLGDPPADVKPMTEEALTKDMEAFIAAQPRAWHDILKNYHGQPYPVLYRAFGNLRHKLGRTNDPPWYRYTISDCSFAWEAKPQAPNHSDPRHIKT